MSRRQFSSILEFRSQQAFLEDTSTDLVCALQKLEVNPGEKVTRPIFARPLRPRTEKLKRSSS